MDGLAALLLLVIVVGLIALVFVVWALVVAVRREDWPWVVALVVSLLALGVVAPIVALVYLIAYREKGPSPASVRQQRRQGPIEEGWYDDPGGEYAHRWWNGSAWTDRVLDDGVARTRPLPPKDSSR